MAKPALMAARIAIVVMVFFLSSAAGFLFSMAVTGKSPVDPQVLSRMVTDFVQGNFEDFNKEALIAYNQFMYRFNNGMKLLMEYVGIRIQQEKVKLERKILFKYRVKVYNKDELKRKLIELTHLDDVAVGNKIMKVYADKPPAKGVVTNLLIKTVGYVQKVKIHGETVVIYSTPYYIEAQAKGVYIRDDYVQVYVGTIKLIKVKKK